MLTLAAHHNARGWDRFCRAGGKHPPASKDRTTEHDRSLEGQPYHIVAPLLGVPHKRRAEDFFTPTTAVAPSYVLVEVLVHRLRQMKILVAFICEISKGNKQQQQQRQQDDDGHAGFGYLPHHMPGHYSHQRIRVAGSQGHPAAGPMDPTWAKQASANLGQTLGVDGGNMGVGVALSQGGGNDGTEAKKEHLPRLPSAEDCVEVCSRSTCKLYVFKEVEVTAYSSCTYLLCAAPNLVFHMQATRLLLPITSATFGWKYKEFLMINVH